MTGQRMMLVDPAGIPGLAESLARGTRRRRLLVACGRDHRLAAVYGTSAGPVLLAEVPVTLTFEPQSDDSWSPTGPWVIGDARAVSGPDQRHRTHARAAEPAAVLLDGHHDQAWLDVSCRCRTPRLTVKWIRTALAAGRRRAVLDEVRDDSGSVQ